VSPSAAVLFQATIGRPCLPPTRDRETGISTTLSKTPRSWHPWVRLFTFVVLPSGGIVVIREAAGSALKSHDVSRLQLHRDLLLCSRRIASPLLVRAGGTDGPLGRWTDGLRISGRIPQRPRGRTSAIRQSRRRRAIAFFKLGNAGATVLESSTRPCCCPFARPFRRRDHRGTPV